MTLFHNLRRIILMFLSSGCGCSCNCTDFFLVQWIAKVLGVVMNGLYELLSTLDILNIGLCIILFTIIVKLLLLPMTIKQHKFTKLSPLINPEVQAIQKKYQNRNDQESMIKMREETNAVYEKYGVSASGSCLQLLIQMPILFALYAVISAIPKYVDDVQDMYMNVSQVVYESVDEYKELSRVDKLIGEEDENYTKLVDKYYSDGEEDEAIEVIYEQLTNYASTSVTDFDTMLESAEEIITEIKEVDNWDELIEDNEKSEKLLTKYSEMSDSELDALLEELNLYKKAVDASYEPIYEVYEFVGINLTKSPSAEMSSGIWWALLIPILSALAQWFSMKISQAGNKQDAADNPMLQSMNTTMMFMPLMSAFLCYTLPSGMGVYWVISSVVQIVQTIFINRYFANKDVNDIIKSNLEKINKKRAAQGLPPKKITEVANVNTKNVKSNNVPAQNTKSTPKNETAYVPTGKKMGIADKANMVKKYNENSKK